MTSADESTVGHLHRQASGTAAQGHLPYHGSRGCRRAGWSYHAAKRSLDLLGAFLLLLVAAPAMAAIALLVMATSRGPILYRQQRLGKNGRPFCCLKFRTMVPEAERILHRHPDLEAEFRRTFKLTNDPRVTPLGRVLRRTSLDELPQLINVLRGEMSLIGPRPVIPSELERYGPHGEKLLRVKPGLGGLWQASGRSCTSYEERVRLDMLYVDSASLTLDLRLLLATAAAVLRCRGAC